MSCHLNMKNIAPVFVFVIYVLFTGCNQVSRRVDNSNNRFSSVLHGLLGQKEYFQLETQLHLLKDSIENKERLFFQAFLDNAFNRKERSIRVIDTLLTNYFSQLSDTTKAALLLLKDDDYFKLYQYAKSARNIDTVLENYQAALDSDKISDIKNDLLIRNALQSVPPQEVIIRERAYIPWKKDRIGLVEIPVRTREQTYDCIFDTRANISSISQTYAAKLGLKMLDVSYEEGTGITGITFKTGLGIADSLFIGDVLLKNVVFQVMPDSILYFPPIKFRLNVIIGFPVIEAFREIQIYKDGKMIIPVIPTKKDLHNFALDGLDPVVSLKTGNDTLCFHLDMGATSTDLYYAYFEKYKPQIQNKGKIKTIQIGGAGGIQKKEVYIIPDFAVYLENKKIRIDSVAVHMEKIHPAEKYFGNLGQDFTSKFNEIIMNFNYMYLSAN
ncbi:MAG: retropepsin-like aspartic protease [Ginsengibacter sp.]